MWDAWVAYSDSACTFLLGNEIDGFQCDFSIIYKTYSLFGEKGRIFCADCTEYRLKKCKIAYNVSGTTYGWQCDYMDTNECCKRHIKCGGGGYELREFDGNIYSVPKCNLEKMSCDVTAFYQRSTGRRNYQDPDFVNTGMIDKLICSECNHNSGYHEFNSWCPRSHLYDYSSDNGLSLSRCR